MFDQEDKTGKEVLTVTPQTSRSDVKGGRVFAMQFKKILLLAGLFCTVFAAAMGYMMIYGAREHRSEPIAVPSDRSSDALRAQNDTSDQGDSAVPGWSVAKDFTLEHFAQQVPGARFMVTDGRDGFLISSPGEGKVYAVQSRPKTGSRTYVVARDIELLGGIATYCVDDYLCYAYLSENDGIYRYEYLHDEHLFRSREKMYTHSISVARRSERPLAILRRSDGNVSLLAGYAESCDGCGTDTAARTGAVVEIPLDEGVPEIYAHGLRNPTVLHVDEETGEVFSVDQGGKIASTSIPDELNVLVRGDGYGWPYCYGANSFNARLFDSAPGNPCLPKYAQPSMATFTPGTLTGIAHVPGGTVWPWRYENGLLIAAGGVLSVIDRKGGIIDQLARRHIDADWIGVYTYGETVYVLAPAWGEVYRLRYVGVLTPPPAKMTISSSTRGGTADTEPFERLGSERLPSCVRAGCNGEVCVDSSRADDIDTLCVYRPEYECLAYATCTRLETGVCGWKETKRYAQCMEENDATNAGTQRERFDTKR